jgi:hydrogenase maturation protease
MTLDQEWDAVLLVDAMPRGEAPGTLFVLEPENDAEAAQELQPLDPHAFGPMQVLAIVRTLEHRPRRLVIVGCEPAILETDELGLSPDVQAAIAPAVELIKELVDDFLSEAAPEPPPVLADAATS